MDTEKRNTTMPEQVSSYRLEGEIARGGMGVVYRGVHMVFEEVVAIKAIFPELMLNQDLRDRFLNEARLQRRLQHPNIVQIREFIAEQDRFYIIMEFIQGDTLSQRLKQLGRPMTIGEAAPIFSQALEGLGYAHRQGVVHRDIKPSNIMLTNEGVAKVTDFGIARGMGSAKLTRTGMAVGTASYMSPEQVLGTQLDQRTDIYSLGITLYEMMTGRVPFGRPNDSDSDFPVLTAHTSQPPPPPRQFAPNIPEPIEAAILKALAKKPEDRFQTCVAFQTALGTDPVPVSDVMAVLRAKPIAPAQTLHGLPVSRGASGPATPEVRPPSPPRPAARPPELQPRSARLAKTEQPRKVWPWVVTLSLLALALLGVAGRQWYTASQGQFKLIATLTGHDAGVTSVAFSPYGRLIASASVDRTIKIWDLPTRKLKWTLAGHTNTVESVIFSPDGQLVASGSDDKTIKVWDVATGGLKETLSGSGNSVLSVAFGPHARRLVSGNWDTTIAIWDVASGARTKTLTGDQAPVSSVTFSPNGRLIASGSDDQTIKLWDAETGEVIRTLTGDDDKVTSVAFSSDGKRLASGSADATARLWDVASGRMEKIFAGHKLWVRAVAFGPDDDLLATASHDNTVKIWDVATGKQTQELKGHTNDVDAVAFSPDGQWIASGSADHTVKLWGRYQ